MSKLLDYFSEILISPETSKFTIGEIAFTKKDCEKVIVLGVYKARDRELEGAAHKIDLGYVYVVRGADEALKRRYESELETLDEMTSRLPPREKKFIN